MNQKFLALHRECTIKYLGIYINESLKWLILIHQLSLQLARYAGILYRIRNLMMRNFRCVCSISSFINKSNTASQFEVTQPKFISNN